MATETAERNTSEQFSAKETALRNVYKYSRKDYFYFYFFLFFIFILFYFILFYFIFIFYFYFLNRSEFEGNGVEEME